LYGFVWMLGISKTNWGTLVLCLSKAGCAGRLMRGRSESKRWTSTRASASADASASSDASLVTLSISFGVGWDHQVSKTFPTRFRRCLKFWFHHKQCSVVWPKQSFNLPVSFRWIGDIGEATVHEVWPASFSCECCERQCQCNQCVSCGHCTKHLWGAHFVSLSLFLTANLEISGTRGPNEGTQRSQTQCRETQRVHPRTSQLEDLCSLVALWLSAWFWKLSRTCLDNLGSVLRG